MDVIILSILTILFVVCFAVGLICLKLFLPKSPKAFGRSLRGKHVLITGGSKGIGRALAEEVTNRGGHVTILARNFDQLETTQAELERMKVWENQKISVIPVDLTDDFEKIRGQILRNLPTDLPVDVLINNTGGCTDGEFEQLRPQDFEQQIRLNFLSAVYVTRILIDQLKQRGQETEEGSRIVLLSSVAGQLGLFGYTAYSPSKFALRGFAESLQMEMKPYNVWITVAYPPNTDTEGYAHECLHSPRETRLINETGGLLQPNEVARRLLDDASRARFCSSFGLDGWLISTLCCGMAPEWRLSNICQQIALMGLFRFVALFYLGSFDRIVKRCSDDKKRK